MTDLANPLSDQIVAEFDHLRLDCGLVDLSDYTFLTLQGEDRKGWLQGQATNNLRSLDAGASSHFCICEPTGHLLTISDIWSAADSFYLSIPIQTKQKVLQRIEQMVILEDVRVLDAALEYRVLSLQGPQATSELAKLVSLPSLDAGITELDGVAVICLRSNRSGLGGWDIWIPEREESVISLIEQKFPKVGREAFEIARIESGIPSFGADCNFKTFPPELGSAFETAHISYNKGCYTGQEVLMRLHSRGNANRTWVGLVAESPFESGNEVIHPVRKDAGHVTSATFSPDYGFIGAAMLRHEVAMNREVVKLQTERGPIEAEIRTMPILRLD